MNGIVYAVERLTRVGLLGVRFWDSITGSVVDDLTVNVFSPTRPDRRVPIMPNRSAVYVVHDLPGMLPAANGAGDAAYWQDPPVTANFIVDVLDVRSRFLPFTFAVRLPAHGLFTPGCPPAGAPPAAIPLFSAPTRIAPGGMAVLRASLFAPNANAPAAWAVLQAQIAGAPPVLGVADGRGEVGLILPYPEPAASAIGSPPGSERRALTDQTWTVQLQAFHAPGINWPAIPDLCQVLNQPPASLWGNASPAQPLPAVTLQHGRDAIVKTSGGSTLLITAAGSLP